ncbi:MAG: class I SAM-dependent methyltransferase [Egicoccus sp.]
MPGSDMPLPANRDAPVGTATLETDAILEADGAAVEAAAERIFGAYVDSMVVLLVDLADRTGMFDVLASRPGTSQEVADRAGLQERYVRECLGGLVTSGIVTYDPTRHLYTLPPAYASCLTGAGSGNLAPLSRIPTLLAHHVEGVVHAFHHGGGVPYERFRPAFTEVMDGLSRGVFDTQLVAAMVPKVEGLTERLEEGIRVADIGCGTGHSTVVLAQAFPASTFDGFELADDALERGRTEAHERGLGNVQFHVQDVAELPSDRPFEAVFAFDVIHDQAQPAQVLRAVHDALTPDGVFVMMDTNCATALEDNVGNPFAPLLYGVSTLHCMTVSLARDGVGLGTCWGRELATDMLHDAGFADVTTHDVPDDPLDLLYVARRG